MKLWSLLLSIALACLIGDAQAADTYSRSEAERYITDAEAARERSNERRVRLAANHGG